MVERMPGAEQLQTYQFEVDKNLFVLERVAPELEMTWDTGNITAEQLNSHEEQIFRNVVAQSLVQVPNELLSASGCTDGRFRVSLLDGSEAPVLQKTVGADVMVLFSMAEALGKKFYGSELDKPAMVRFKRVVEFARDNGLYVMTHVGCGARGGYQPVIDKGATVAANDTHASLQTKRIELFTDLTDVSSHDLQAVSDEWHAHDLADYNDAEAQQIIIDINGEKAVKQLQGDPEDHLTHGHHELAKMRLRTPGYTISARQFISLLSDALPERAGSQVFTNNDDRYPRLAQMIADDESSMRTALIAGEFAADSGYAVLSKNLATYTLTMAE